VTDARPARLGLLLALASALALASSWGYCLQDDAFISFRYARNLVDGHGLVFNPGEAVEGYTNPSWTVLSAGLIALGLSPELPIIAAGVLGLLGLITVGWRLAVTRGGPAAVGAAGLIAMHGGASLEAVQGLESTAFAALVAAGLWARLTALSAEGAGNPASTIPFSALLCAAAALTRPEGWLLMALLEGLPLLGRALPGPGGGLRAALTAVPARLPAWGTFLLIAGAHLVWRWQTYGELVPNTFFVKVGGTEAQALRGLRYLADQALAQPTGAALALVGATLGLGGLRGPAAARAQTALILGLPAVFLAYVAAVGGDFKATGRFVLPLLGPLGLLAAGALAAAGARLGRPWLPVAAALLLGAVDLGRQLPALRAAADERNAVALRDAAVGRFLHENARPDAVLAIHSAGAVPYYSGLRTIDMWGLSDKHIGRRPVATMGQGMAGHEKTDYDYVFGRDPDLYLPQDLLLTPTPAELPVPSDFPADFERRYRQLSVQVGDEGWLNLFVRADAPPLWRAGSG
jgi:hypothetical protein